MWNASTYLHFPCQYPSSAFNIYASIKTLTLCGCAADQKILFHANINVQVMTDTREQKKNIIGGLELCFKLTFSKERLYITITKPHQKILVAWLLHWVGQAYRRRSWSTHFHQLSNVYWGGNLCSVSEDVDETRKWSWTGVVDIHNQPEHTDY